MLEALDWQIVAYLCINRVFQRNSRIWYYSFIGSTDFFFMETFWTNFYNNTFWKSLIQELLVLHIHTCICAVGFHTFYLYTFLGPRQEMGHNCFCRFWMNTFWFMKTFSRICASFWAQGKQWGNFFFDLNRFFSCENVLNKFFMLTNSELPGFKTR